MASTFFLVTGALLVGDALHGSVVTGQYPVTSPAAVLRGVAGLVFVGLGYRLQVPASEYASTSSNESVRETDESEAGTSDGGDFDPELSPLSDEEFEELDADDGK